MSTVDYPARERFDAWTDLISRAIAPITITAPDPAAYVGRMMAGQYGQVNVVSMSSSTCVGRRTARLINQADPDAVQVMLVNRGTTEVGQNGVESTLRSGDLAIYTTWRPYTMHATADPAGLVTGTTALIPRHQLPLTTNILERLAARTISGRADSGALVAGMLTGLTKQPAMPPAAAERLACALADVLAVALGAAADQLTTLSPETIQSALFTQVRAFIRHHLADFGLTPSTVAAAHHISIRSLHRLFEGHGDTATRFIRRSRLEQCRRDLSDPRLRNHPIQDIAARWGFSSPHHFNRRFREQTGMPPGQYRRIHLQPHDEPTFPR